MVYPDGRLRLAVLGARGIGKVHARLFQVLGADVCAVLGSTSATAAVAVRDLEESFGIQAKPYSRLEDLLEEPLDAVSICTPPHIHFEQVLAAFDSALPVFCEKPLLWRIGITSDEVDEQLKYLASHANRRLFVNTSNASFLDSIRERLPDPSKIDSFFFRFYTQGVSKGKDIAVDLLPHGISLLLRFFGQLELENLSEEIASNNYRCRFSYGHCLVEFDFQEISGGTKALAFTINGRTFSRIQEGFGATYRVFLHDSKGREKIEVSDPFSTYIAQFLNYCKSGAPSRQDKFGEAAANVQLMTRILLQE